MKRRGKLDQELPHKGGVGENMNVMVLRGGVSGPAHTKETPGWRDTSIATHEKNQIHDL